MVVIMIGALNSDESASSCLRRPVRDDPPHGVFVGLTTLDTVYRVAALPAANEKIAALGQEFAAGGPAANAAVTFAALGGRATLVTALGGHVLARHAADELAGRGVQMVDAVPTVDLAPAVSSIYVIEATGDRSVVSVNGTAVQAPAPGELGSIVARADVVLVDGHHSELAIAAARLARERAVPVVLDGGSWKPALEELLPLVDVAICSADFAVPGAAAEAGAITRALRRWGVSAAAVTHGGEPICWSWGDASGEVAVPRVAVRDTLGAGDAFHGAFAYSVAVAPAAMPAGALAFAAQVAALRCTVPGPRAWLALPALAELVSAMSGPAAA
ncbi:PfkB family carbohydrate kinase [Micromonospora sp. NPDC005113]